MKRVCLPGGDVLVGHAGRDEPEDLGLAGRQLGDGPARACRFRGRLVGFGGHPAELAEDEAGQPGGEDGLAARRREDRVDDLLRRRGLDEVAGRPRLDGGEDVVLLPARAEDEHPGRQVECPAGRSVPAVGRELEEVRVEPADSHSLDEQCHLVVGAAGRGPPSLELAQALVAHDPAV